MVAASGAGASIPQQLNSSSSDHQTGSFNIASIMANGGTSNNNFRTASRFHHSGKRDSSRNSSGSV
jgi:hypothetical protein